MIKEIWEDIKDYEGFYQISNTGKVKSLEREVKYRNNSSGIVKERMLKYSKSHPGYYYVCLAKKGNRKHHSIHRLLAVHFVDNPNNYKWVDHIDRNKLNNNLDNLRWVSISTNSRNSKSSDNASSPFNGVSWCKRTKKWCSHINVKGKQKHLGYFHNEGRAALAFDIYCVCNNLDRELNII